MYNLNVYICLYRTSTEDCYVLLQTLDFVVRQLPGGFFSPVISGLMRGVDLGTLSELSTDAHRLQPQCCREF